MDTPFYATMKLVTGEEILAEVMVNEELGETFLVLHDPITVSENTQIDAEKGLAFSGLVPKKWLLYSNDDLLIVNKNHIITITEMDKFGIDFYKKALLSAKVSSPIRRKIESSDHSGYVGDIEASRNKIKRMYDMSHDVPEN